MYAVSLMGGKGRVYAAENTSHEELVSSFTNGCVARLDNKERVWVSELPSLSSGSHWRDVRTLPSTVV